MVLTDLVLGDGLHRQGTLQLLPNRLPPDGNSSDLSSVFHIVNRSFQKILHVAGPTDLGVASHLKCPRKLLYHKV